MNFLSTAMILKRTSFLNLKTNHMLYFYPFKSGGQSYGIKVGWYCALKHLSNHQNTQYHENCLQKRI